ncbi:MAG: ASPIC/UnbV domain-containing protein [Balneolaceae bacterium]|nr:ASPIC/UnbV domain-containing protein [Balneolaceae bacterium]
MKKVELRNFAFKNNGDLSFNDVSDEWGVDQHALSNGAAYADLDNNGTLDLIVHNINESPFIFNNTARQQNGNNFLKIHLEGTDKNPSGIGTRITVIADDGTTFYQEKYPVRGFQSSVDPDFLFGLGNHKQVDIQVVWPDQSSDMLRRVSANQTIVLQQDSTKRTGELPEQNNKSKDQMFLMLDEAALGLNYTHNGAVPVDKNRSPLLPHTLNNLGPALAKGDLNNDGLQDLFIGGGQNQSGKIYLQQKDGTYTQADLPALDEHRSRLDVEASFLMRTMMEPWIFTS